MAIPSQNNPDRETMYALVRIFIKFISQIENQGARFVSRVTFFLRMNSSRFEETVRTEGPFLRHFELVRRITQLFARLPVGTK